jgi:hypothetical protein
MINAARGEVASRVRQRAVAILEKELNYYTANLQTVSKQCAAMAGFSFAGLAMPFDRKMLTEAHMPTRLALFAIISTASMVLNLVALWIATMAAIKGPRLGLLGQAQETMSHAVRQMRRWSGISTRMHEGGVCLFFTAAAFLSWLKWGVPATVTMVALTLAGLRGIRWSHAEIAKSFSLGDTGVEEDAFGFSALKAEVNRAHKSLRSVNGGGGGAHRRDGGGADKARRQRAGSAPARAARPSAATDGVVFSSIAVVVVGGSKRAPVFAELDARGVLRLRESRAAKKPLHELALGGYALHLPRTRSAATSGHVMLLAPVAADGGSGGGGGLAGSSAAKMVHFEPNEARREWSTWEAHLRRVCARVVVSN